MSLNRLVENTFKPWLNIRVNNLTVDGTITGGGIIPFDPTVRESGTIPALSPNPSLFATVTLPTSLFPVTDIWYKAVFTTFITRDDNTSSRGVTSNVIFYIDPTYTITNLSASPSPVGPLDFQLTYTSPASLQISATKNALNDAVAYRYTLLISDVIQLV
jgi:hypothetical protein